jgi:uncharacterized protein (DUF1778 family)
MMENTKKTHIAFRVNEDDYNLIVALAADSHLPVGTFLKQLVRREFKEHMFLKEYLDKLKNSKGLST